MNGSEQPNPPAFRLAAIQMAMTDDPAANTAAALDRVRMASAQGAQVVVLPELFRTPYFCQREDPAFFDLAEPVPGPTTALFANAARELGVAVVVPLFERRAPGVHHNSAAVIDADGRIAGLYRKAHIPDDPGYYEKYYFAPGDTGFRAFPTRFGRIGVVVCWDQWFPEAARLTAMAGADVIVAPTAIGWHPREIADPGPQQLDAWRTVQRGHAIANGVPWVAVNRVGHERPAADAPGLVFWGGSFACDAFGVTLAEAPPDREAIMIVAVDPARTDTVRRLWPFLRDRRIDLFDAMNRRWNEPEY